MHWQLFGQATPNFARCFHSGFGVLVIGAYTMLGDAQKKKLEEGSYEYKIRVNLSIFWMISMLVFCATFCVKSYYNIRNGRHNWKPRHQKLKDLKVGIIGLIACCVVEIFSSIYMIYNDCAGYIVLVFAHVAAMIFLGLYILEQSYMCKLPQKFFDGHMWITLITLVVGAFIFVTYDQIICFQAAYITIISCFLIDGYTVFADSSRIHFLGEFLGKRVVCKDLNGNEHRGDFVSVDVDTKKKLYMRLKLKRVEKMSEGEFVKHPGHVTLDEISSLKLADDQPSTLTVCSSEVQFLNNFLKKRVVCKDNEGNEYRGDVAYVSADLENEFSFVKLRNVEKKCDGKFVKHTEDVSLLEVASLELDDVKIENKKTA